MNLDPFAEYLRLLISESVFVWHMPENYEVGVLLLSSLPGSKLHETIPCYKRGKFNAIIRHRDYQSGYSLSKQVSEHLKMNRQNLDEGLINVKFCRPTHDPVAFPSSKGDLIEFSINFETSYVEY